MNKVLILFSVVNKKMVFMKWFQFYKWNFKFEAKK